jgi:predicted lipoprotein with Yx(FWY)xxD motif
MRRTIALITTLATLSASMLVGAALGEANSTSRSQASKGALVALGKTGLGRVLVDTRGRTLYLFEKDTARRSGCYGACAAYWPPLLSAAKPRPGRGVRPSLLGVTRRTDGTRQVTYAGHPLYRFIGDSTAGQTSGQGLDDFGAAWYVVAASGRAVESGGGGRGYGG